jgi:hypothetical protein
LYSCVVRAGGSVVSKKLMKMWKKMYDTGYKIQEKNLLIC